MRSIAALVIVMMTASAAYAETDHVAWYRGERGRKRLLHLSITAAAGLSLLAPTTVARDPLAPDQCRWCDVPAFDRHIRTALVWDNKDRADLYSSIDAYVVAPIVGLALLAISDRDASLSRLIDDTLPVAETVAITQLVTQVIKISVARRRPYRAFGDPNAPTSAEDNLSFSSGHASLGFAITVSAGMICHWRHYWTEPYVWSSGIVLSLTTEYLRIGADKHYMTDVLAGGAIGIASGLLIPRLLRTDIKIAPIPGGAAVVGMF